MKNSLALLLALSLGPAVAQTDDAVSGARPATALSAVLMQADTALFAAFNRCSEPEQLAAYTTWFTPDTEFYHDTGGVTWTRDAMVANTAKYACGNYTRELVAGSLHVYPVKEFGAITQGVHRFCQVATGVCEGEADFVMVWQRQDDRWQVTRTLSYGHRPAPVGPLNDRR